MLSETFWVFVLGVIVLFVFFVIMGALSPAQAVGVTAAVAILAALWIGHDVAVAPPRGPRHRRDPRARAARP